MYFDESGKPIDGTEPDWSMWQIDHCDVTTDEDGNTLEERVYCRRITDEEIEEETRQELVSLLPDAVADLSQVVSENGDSVNDLSDAIAELSEIVSNLAEGMKNNG